MPRKAGKESASFQHKRPSRVNSAWDARCLTPLRRLGLTQPSPVYEACGVRSCLFPRCLRGIPMFSVSHLHPRAHRGERGKVRTSEKPQSEIRGSPEPARWGWVWRQARGGQEGGSWKEFLNPASHSPFGDCCPPGSRGAEGGWQEGFLPHFRPLWGRRAPFMDEETEAREASSSPVGAETLRLSADCDPVASWELGAVERAVRAGGGSDSLLNPPYLARCLPVLPERHELHFTNERSGHSKSRTCPEVSQSAARAHTEVFPGQVLLFLPELSGFRGHRASPTGWSHQKEPAQPSFQGVQGASGEGRGRGGGESAVGPRTPEPQVPPRGSRRRAAESWAQPRGHAAQ